MEKDFDYYAFISYKHEDEKWAKWLQNKLENYKLPAIIRKENADLPQKIRPVFRDKTDMEAGVIIDTIQKKLERSQYLIVICSPQAAKSNWVGSEISAFIEMGRSDRIIPFIVDGVPNSNDSRECFHPHIKEKIPEPLGVNINEIGKQQAFIKTAAKLLNLRFDILWDRFRIAQRKRRLIAAAAGLLCIAALGWVFDYFYPKKEYYADYVDRWGIPEGIIRLNKAQVKKRNTHYRFEYSQKKLRKVIYANSAGTPVEYEDIDYVDRPSIQELEYVGDRLNKTFIKNKKGKTITTYFWPGKDHNAIDIINDETGESDVLGAINSLNKAIIKRFKLERNDDGYIIRREFKRNNGDDDVPARNIDGIEGFEYNLDNFGRPVKIRYLGPPDMVGVTGKKYEYDSYGNIRKTTYFGENEEPVLNKLGWSTAVYEADTKGNIISEYFLNNNGEPCTNTDNIAKITYKYDERGNITEEAYFDINDNSYNLVSKIKHKYNKQGNITEEAHFDANGNLYNLFGIAKVIYEYDKQGNIIEESHFGNDGEPYRYIGYARVTYKYDDQGNIIERAQFGADGKPPNFNYAKVTYKYEQGNIIEEAYFDSHGEPYLMGGDEYTDYGYTRVTYKYNKQGNMIEETYFGTDGKLCFPYLFQKYARTRYEYDDQGNLTEIAYFGTDGKPCLAQFGGYAKRDLYERSYAKVKYKYDKQGNMTEETYFDTDDKPRLIETGYAKIEYKYDKGNMTEAYFNIDGKPCLDIYRGYAKAEYKYDERRNMTEAAYFNTNGKPCLMEGNYAKVTYKYDKIRNMTEEAYFGTDGKLCLAETDSSYLTGFNYAKATYKYDDRRGQLEAVYFDANDNIIMKKN